MVDCAQLYKPYCGGLSLLFSFLWLCFSSGPCVSSPCMNGGTCIEDVYTPGNFLCMCQDQYTGATCTIPPNAGRQHKDIASSILITVCFYLVYIILQTGWGHKVTFFWNGVSRIDPCVSSPCQNGALCTPSNTGASYTCNCPNEFLGQNCDIPGKNYTLFPPPTKNKSPIYYKWAY